MHVCLCIHYSFSLIPLFGTMYFVNQVVNIKLNLFFIAEPESFMTQLLMYRLTVERTFCFCSIQDLFFFLSVFFFIYFLSSCFVGIYEWKQVVNNKKWKHDIDFLPIFYFLSLLTFFFLQQNYLCQQYRNF